METRFEDLYELVEDPTDKNADHWCIKLTKGPFAGLIYKYDTVGFAEEPNDEGFLTTRFEYDIISVPEKLKEEVFSDEEEEGFNRLLGNILVEIINDDLERHKENEPTGIDDTTRDVVRRTVYKEGSSFLKK